MNLIAVEKNVVLASSRNEYNKNVWFNTVERYCKYDNVIFFKDEAKEDFYVVYSLEDGIRFIQEISYTSSLTSSGFKIANIGYNGQFTVHLFSLDGNFGVADNTKSNRVKLAKLSKDFGTIFTNSF